jgi:hypothetical protein
MQKTESFRKRPELKQMVVEASQALARLDVGRLEELAVSCQALNRELAASGARGRLHLAHQARDAAWDMAVFARVLEATRENQAVLDRLQALRAGRFEYSEAQALGWSRVESPHGDN